MTTRLQRLNTIFLLLFALVALALGYWGVARSSVLLARDDNPRLVEAELRVQRGRIVDRAGARLAETAGEPGNLQRIYQLPSSPAVGHYSLRYGVSGIEAAYDSVLRGRGDDPRADWWEALLHRAPVGRDVQLTLDAELQAAADRALSGWTGAAVLLDARSGEILAMVSQPGYDPNLLDEQFDALSADETAPLLNRVTQGMYQPGTALQPFLLAAALEANEVQPESALENPADPVRINGLELYCAAPPADGATLASAVGSSCPAASVALVQALGPVSFSEGLAAFGLLEAPAVPLQQALTARPDLTNGTALPAEAVGQGALTVSPLQMAWATAGLANEGQLPALRLVNRIDSDAAGWEIVVPPAQAQQRSTSPQAAQAVARAMALAVREGAASSAAVPEETVAGHVGVAYSGPEETPDSWFLGFAPAAGTGPLARFTVVVVLEGTADTDAAARIGGLILSAALR